MLVLISNYFSILSQCKLRYLSHCGTSLCMPLLEKLAAKSFIEVCTKSFVSWSLLRPWLAKSFLSWRNKWSSLDQDGNCMVDARKFPIWPVQVMCMYGQQRAIMYCNAFFEQSTQFPPILFVHCTFAMHHNSLLANSPGWKLLVFKICITDHVLGSLLSCSSLTTTVNGGENYDTGLHNTCVPLHIQKMSDLHRKCICHPHGFHFLHVPHTDK